jgi:hypothetical protein
MKKTHSEEEEARKEGSCGDEWLLFVLDEVHAKRSGIILFGHVCLSWG